MPRQATTNPLEALVTDLREQLQTGAEERIAATQQSCDAQFQALQQTHTQLETSHQAATPHLEDLKTDNH